MVFVIYLLSDYNYVYHKNKIAFVSIKEEEVA